MGPLDKFDTNKKLQRNVSLTFSPFDPNVICKPEKIGYRTNCKKNLLPIRTDQTYRHQFQVLGAKLMVVPIMGQRKYRTAVLLVNLVQDVAHRYFIEIY